MWKAAKGAYPKNFPTAAFYHGRLEEVSPRSVKQRVGKIDLILASPECRSHSQARGAAKRSKPSRDTAFQVIRFAETLKPRWIVVENVSTMRRWSRYKRGVV
jgi:DNA (cytosine-5)-methyltransferase 1